MTTVVINEKTKVGKNVLELIKSLLQTSPTSFTIEEDEEHEDAFLIEKMKINRKKEDLSKKETDDFIAQLRKTVD